MKGNLWNSWSEYLNVSETDALDDFPEKLVPRTKSDVMKLPFKDMNLFGYCSEYDDFYLVICDICGMRIKPQSLKSHMELRHKNEYEHKFSPSGSVQEIPLVIDEPTCSSKNLNDKHTLSKYNSETSFSKTKDKLIISNKKHMVFVQPYPKPSYTNSCPEKNVCKLASYSPSSDVVTTLTKSMISENHESLKNTYVMNMSCPESSLSTCDSQKTSMTVFLHHSFLMPNMKLCDINDQCTNFQCLNSKTMPTNNYLSQAAVLTQVFPEKMFENPNQSSQVLNLSKDVAGWDSQQNSLNLGLNAAAYSEWNQHSAHFRPLSHDAPPMHNSEQMHSHSFNCSDLKKFDDLESQVLIHNATMGT